MGEKLDPLDDLLVAVAQELPLEAAGHLLNKSSFFGEVDFRLYLVRLLNKIVHLLL